MSFGLQAVGYHIHRLRRSDSRRGLATTRAKRARLRFEHLESRHLLAAWQTVGEASIADYTVRLGQTGEPEDGSQEIAVHAATLQLPEAPQYRIGFEYQLASWDSYNNASLGNGKGYWDVFTFSVTDTPYASIDRQDPLSFPGRGFTWGGSTFGDSNLATAASTVYQTFSGSADQPSYLNVALDTEAPPDTDEAYPSWGRIVVHANDIGLDELRMAETEEPSVEFDYTIIGNNVPATMLDFYWASGPEEGSIMSGAPIVTYTLGESSPLSEGQHTATVSIPPLNDPPQGASHLLVRSRTFSNEMITTNNVAALDILGTYPLRLEVVGGDFSYNESSRRYEASGTILIGLAPGENEDFQGLLKLEGSAWYSKQTISLNGRFYANLGPAMPVLFEGEVKIRNGSTKSVSLTDATADENQFEFGGLAISMDSIAFRSDGLGLQGSVSLPQELSGATLSVKGDHWLLFTNQGTQLTGGKIDMPDVSITIENVLELEATGLAVEYTGATASTPATLKLQGAVNVPAVFGFKGDFAGENYIQVSEQGVELVGRVSVEDVVFVPQVWELNEAFVAIDTTKGELVGGGSLRIPAGVDIEGQMGFVGGELDQIMLGVSELDLPLGASGVFLQSVSGSLDNLTGNDPPSFTGTVGITYGPEISVPAPEWLGGAYSGALLRADVGATIDRHSLTGNGSLDLISANPDSGLVEGDATSTVNWTEEFISAAGQLQFLGGLVQYNASFRGDASFDLDLMGGAEVRLPDVAFIPFLNGQLLGNGQVHFRYRNNGSGGDDFVKLWGTADLPYYGLRTIGIKLDFNGDTELIGDFDSVPPQAPSSGEGEGGNTIGQFTVAAGTEELLLHIEWENPASLADYTLVAPDGTNWNAAQIAADPDLSEVDFFASDTTRAIAVRVPQEGLWRIQVSNLTELGSVQADAFRDAVNEVPTFEFLGMTSDTDSHYFDYSLEDPDSDATVQFFVTEDPTFHGGFEVDAGDEAGSLANWYSGNAAAGEYWVYALVEDGTNVTQKVTWPDSITIANHEPWFLSRGAWDLTNRVVLQPGESLRTEFTATDIDSDDVQFELLGGPSFASLTSLGVLEATPPEHQLSSRRHELRAVVSDDADPSLFSEETLILVEAGSNEIQGVLAPGEAMSWVRDVRQGQDLRLTPLHSHRLGLKWEVRDASNAIIYSGSANELATVPVQTTGVVELRLSADAAATVADIPFQIAISEVTSVGQATLANFDYTEQSYEFQFEATAGERLLVEMIEQGGFEATIGFVVEAPDGRFFRLGIQDGYQQRLSIFSATTTGIHRLYVTASDVYYEDAATEVAFAIRSIESSSNVPVGQPTSVTVPAGGTQLVYLEGTFGQTLQLQALTENYELIGTLYDTDQRTIDALSSFAVADPQILLVQQPGPYFLVIGSSSSEDQTFSMLVSELTPEPIDWQYGERLTDTAAGSPVELTVPLQAGEILFIDAHCDAWSEESCGPAIFQDDQLIASPGDFGIVADGQKTYQLIATRPFDFTLHKLDASHELQPGVPTEFTFTSNDVALPFWIQTTPGQQISWSTGSESGDGMFTTYFGTAGAYETSHEVAQTIFHEGPTLIGLQNYSADAEGDPVTVTISFTLTDSEATDLAYDNKYQGTVNSEQPQSFIFTAQAGDQLFYNALDVDTFASVWLSGPGGLLFERPAGENVGLFEVPLSGRYELRFTTDGDSDSYAFKLNNLANAIEIGYDQDESGELDQGLESKWWSFPGFEGQKVALVADAAFENQTEVLVFTPSGQYLITGPLSIGLFATLPEDGMYTMAVIGNGQATGDFGFAWKQIHTSWQNPSNPMDVNGDGKVLPIDALVVINYLNRNGGGILPEPDEGRLPPPFLDVSGSGSVAPLDALRVLNYLNRGGQNGEAGQGEGEATEAFNAPPIPEREAPLWSQLGDSPLFALRTVITWNRHSEAAVDRVFAISERDAIPWQWRNGFGPGSKAERRDYRPLELSSRAEPDADSQSESEGTWQQEVDRYFKAAF